MSASRVIWAGVAAVGLMAAASPSLQAHHSFPATYEVDKLVTIEGTVKQFMFRNPHSFVHVLAPSKDGKGVLWAVEWGAAGTLGSQNVQGGTLKPGDKVIVIGNPARDKSAHRMRMQSIERPADGFKWAGTFS